MIELDDKPEHIPKDEAEDTKVLKVLSTAYVEEYNKAEALTNELKELKKNLENLAQQFVDKCLESGLTGIKTEFGSFSPKVEESIGYKKDKEEEVFKFLEEAGHGASIKRTIHFQTLNKHYRDGEIEWNEEAQELFTSWTRKKIQMRRKK